MMQSVQVIIERLKSHPEDFFGEINERNSMTIKQPKFYDIVSKLDDLLLEKTEHPHRLWYLEPEEKDALLAAYKEARRARFEAKMFHTLLTKQEPEEYNTVTERMTSSGKRLMQGFTDPRSIIAPPSMVKQAREILEKEFDKEYAKNRNT